MIIKVIEQRLEDGSSVFNLELSETVLRCITQAAADHLACALQAEIEGATNEQVRLIAYFREP